MYLLSFLLSLGGRIDHGHHDGNAYTALHDTVELGNAVKKANEMTKESMNIHFTDELS